MVSDALSCYASLISRHSETKQNKKPTKLVTIQRGARLRGGSRIFIGGGGGGRKRLYARTHVTSAKSEVLFGRDPGPA